MSFFQDIPIRQKLMRIIMLTSTVTLLLAGLMLIGYEIITFRQAGVRELRTLADIIGANSSAALEFNDSRAGEETLAGLKANPSIIAASIYNKEGVIFAKYRRRSDMDNATIPSKPGKDVDFLKEGHLGLFRPVLFGKERIGTIYLQHDLHPVYNRLKKYGIITVLVLATSLFIAFVLSSKLQGIISGPISQLTKTVSLVSDRKDYSIRAVKQTKDEVGLLVEQFNEMLVIIQKRDADLQAAHDWFEERANELPHEISARMQAQESLQISIRQFNSLIESCHDGIIAYDKEICYTLWNPAMERLFGIKAKDLIGKTPFEVFNFFDEIGEGDAFREAVNNKPTNRPAMPFYVTETGEKGYFESSHFPLYDAQGNVIGGMGVIRNVTERIRSAEQAKLQQEKLLQADKMASLGILVAGIGHEINNPVSFIIMNAPLLGEIWEDIKPLILSGAKTEGEKDLAGMPFDKTIEAFPKLLEGIINGSNRIKKIVMGLRDFARTDSSDYNDLINIKQVIESSKSLMLNLIQKKTKKIRININKVPPVRGSFQKLEQVFVNLISNSCFALTDPNQALEITASHDQSLNLVIIKIKDEGKGMDRETLRKVIEPFFSTRHDSGGTGLGVSISYGIIKKHSGTMEYTSEPSKGTTVTITLPVEERREDGT